MRVKKREPSVWVKNLPSLKNLYKIRLADQNAAVCKRFDCFFLRFSSSFSLFLLFLFAWSVNFYSSVYGRFHFIIQSEKSSLVWNEEITNIRREGLSVQILRMHCTQTQCLQPKMTTSFCQYNSIPSIQVTIRLNHRRKVNKSKKVRAVSSDRPQIASENGNH